MEKLTNCIAWHVSMFSSDGVAKMISGIHSDMIPILSIEKHG